MMRRTLILLLSAAFSAQALSLRPVPSVELDACATVDCASGLTCAMAIAQSCNVSPCPKMPTCLPTNQTCSTNSCKADETCVLRSVTCVMAPCYPVRSCEKYPKCGANEEYNECSLSGPCEPNCKDSFPICLNVTCGTGACECKAGYFRENGKCITKDECPTPTCEKPNEVWSTCPSACPQTCRILRGKEEQMICPAVCGSPQCTCAVGYVRDDDWNCVKEADCPKEFKCNDSHEEYKECSSHCEPTCENRMPSCIDSCGPAKCQCKPDYVRHNGHCLFGLQCPMEGNSTLSPVHGDDDGSVESGESEEQEGPSCDAVRCADNKVCMIKKGRAKCGKCGKNEKIDACPNACSETSCGEPEGRMCAGVKMCLQPRCVCDEGFVRNMKSGKCIVRSKCPTGDNSTMHILPIGPSRPAPRPAFPFFNRTDDGQMHILPHFQNVNNNETMHIRPFFPSGNASFHYMPIIENGTVHIMPHFENGTMNILPFIPADNENGTMHIMPFPGDGSVHIMPIAENGTAHVRPFFPGNGTFHTMPISENGTMSILPFYPGVNGSIQISPPKFNGTKLVMPRLENGTMNILPFNGTAALVRPFFPGNGTFHTMPVKENGTMHIMPFPGDGSVHIMPIAENGSMHTMPFFPGNRSVQISPPRPHVMPRENGTMHIMPHLDDGSVHILPYIPNELIDPVPHIMPFPEEGAVHIMPVNENGTMHTLPFFPNNNRTRPLIMPRENGTMSILPHTRPYFGGNASFHTMPVRENGTMNILPFHGNASVHVMPVTKPLVMPRENGTMHIMPFPGNASVHVKPFIPSNGSTINVCANHTCPEGSWCEETPVMCIMAGPCPPIPTCVSVHPGARDQPTCGKNEQFSSCAPRCQETCRGISDCVEVATLACTAGCVCRPHFKRDGKGHCVPGKKCWKSNSCQENEVWHQCRACEPTCTDAKEVCAASCSTGCACDDGYVRSPTGDCVEQKKCPKGTTTKTSPNLTTTTKSSNLSSTTTQKPSSTTKTPSSLSTTTTARA